ncbi:MAG: tRNA lysidine(34) synthetase TilS [Clostridia bacterium]|nr:tRNA lysidine(34) synthetase TilS [Clostridia bacterium]
MEYERLKQRVSKTLETNEIQSALVGVSGGADSVCLLRCLIDIAAERGVQLTAIHAEHDLRTEAPLDAAFVETLCSRFHVPLIHRKVHVTRQGSIEAAARAVRYEAFEEAYRTCEADALFLAHHLNDQAETVLMRMIRGSGLTGISGMSEKSRYGGMLIVRPFLSVPRSDIEAALSQLSQTWITDSTNEDTEYTRNYLRHEILKPLASRFPGSLAGIARTAEIAALEDDFLADQTTRFLTNYAVQEGPNRFMEKQALLLQHPALQRRAIRAFLKSYADISYDKTLEIIDALKERHKTVNVSEQTSVFITEKYIHVLFPTEPLAAPDVFYAVQPYRGQPMDGKRTQAVPTSLLKQTEVRCGKVGDRFVPFGKHTAVSLGRYLIEKKIDLPFRKTIPLLTLGDMVLWIPGVDASELTRIQEGMDDACLLTVNRRLPWQLNRTEE